MTKPTVLITVEGGIPDAHVIGDVNVAILDWDNLEEAETLDEVDDIIDQIESLPDGLAPTIDKPGILKTLRAKRADLAAMLASA